MTRKDMKELRADLTDALEQVRKAERMLVDAIALFDEFASLVSVEPAPAGEPWGDHWAGRA